MVVGREGGGFSPRQENLSSKLKPEKIDMEHSLCLFWVG